MNIYEIYIVTAILCGAVAAWIAKEKGRSPVIWFCVGAALNVLLVTVFVIAAARKKQRLVS